MRKLLLVGYPSAGKSTFLAALWEVVQVGGIPGALRLDRVEGNREYIERLHRHWQGCEPLERTLNASGERVRMHLRHPHNGLTVELVFPDLAGEVFEEHWRDRAWTLEYDNLAKDASAILLFVHADDVYKPLLTADFAPTLTQADNNTPTGAVGHEAVLYNPDKACLQVKLVEMLQFHLARLEQNRPLRVAVIVSAWDVVESTDRIESLAAPAPITTTPNSFLSARIPLLSQFLRANSDVIYSSVWGVSAQGGDLDEDEERASLEAVDDPSARIKVMDGDGNPVSESVHDITAPVQWAVV